MSNSAMEPSAARMEDSASVSTISSENVSETLGVGNGTAASVISAVEDSHMDVDHEETLSVGQTQASTGLSTRASAGVSLAAKKQAIATLQTSIDIVNASIASLTAIISASPHDEEIKNQRVLLANKMKDLAMFTKALKVMKDDPATTTELKRSTFVPKNLPLFQWEGQVIDAKLGQVFADIKLCLQNFEDVMVSNGLDLDSNFLRVVPPLLSQSTRTWYTGHLANFQKTKQRDPTWAEFSADIIARYGINIYEERANCARELDSISMNPEESIESFIDRFNSLRRRAVDHVLPDSILLDKFGLALPSGLYKEICLATSTLPEYKKKDVDIFASYAREFYNKFKGEYNKGKSATSTSATASSSSGQLQKKRGARENTASGTSASLSTQASKYAHDVPSSGRRSPGKNGRWCTFHKVGSHTTENCRAVKKSDNSGSSVGTSTSSSKFAASVSAPKGSCRKCGEPNWTRAHQCKTTATRSFSNSTERRFAGMNLVDSSPTLASSSNAHGARSSPSSGETPNASTNAVSGNITLPSAVRTGDDITNESMYGG